MFNETHHWLSLMRPSGFQVTPSVWDHLKEGVNQFTQQLLKQLFAILDCLTVRLFHGATILGVLLDENFCVVSWDGIVRSSTITIWCCMLI